MSTARLAADDLCAFGLGDAAGDGDHPAAVQRPRAPLQLAQAAEFGIDLLGRLLADVAGVQNDEIGLVGVAVST